MARINSKRKGNTNERAACRFMERWTGEEFIRIANSGGTHNASTWLAGDIVPVTPEFLIEFDTVVETKHLKYLGCLDGTRSNSKIGKIFSQAVVDKNRVNAARALALLRQNGMKKDTFIVVVKINQFNEAFPWFLRLDDLLLFNSEDIVDINYKLII